MDGFFKYLNVFPMPLWLAMMFAPKHRLTERASRSSIVFIVAAAHYLLALVKGVWQGAKEGDGRLPDFSSLEGISEALGTRPGALGAWAHMLALDLFTGAWIYRQCRRLGAPDWVRISSLFLTLMTGPFGLFLFLIMALDQRRAG